MTAGIYQLTFIVTHRASAPALTDAQRLNRAFDLSRLFDGLGLTGVLMERCRATLCCIEGEEAKVSAEYERFKRHPHNGGVVVLRQKERDGRDFHNWGFTIERDPREHLPPTLIDRLIMSLSHAPQEIRRTFLAFARVEAPGHPH